MIDRLEIVWVCLRHTKYERGIRVHATVTTRIGMLRTQISKCWRFEAAIRFEVTVAVDHREAINAMHHDVLFLSLDWGAFRITWQ